MTEKLKACQICGGEARPAPHHYRNGWWEIECLKCGVKSGPLGSIKSASEAWNTRPTETAGMDDALREAVKWVQIMWHQVSNRAPQDDEAMTTLITHALKGESK